MSVLANGSRLWFAIAAVLALRPDLRRTAAEGAVAALLAAGGVQVVNHLVDRPRPTVPAAGARRPASPSFPSSHTAVGVAFTTAVARRSPRLGAVLAPLAATLAYGRIRLRLHWPTDVLTGAVLGLGSGTSRRTGHQRGPDHADHPLGAVTPRPRAGYCSCWSGGSTSR